jgi:hypothetical protein
MTNLAKVPSGQHTPNVVWVVGFEPTTSGTQSRPSTKLRHTQKELTCQGKTSTSWKT